MSEQPFGVGNCVICGGDDPEPTEYNAPRVRRVALDGSGTWSHWDDSICNVNLLVTAEKRVHELQAALTGAREALSAIQRSDHLAEARMDDNSYERYCLLCDAYEDAEDDSVNIVIHHSSDCPVVVARAALQSVDKVLGPSEQQPVPPEETTVEDGFGNSWGPCEQCGAQMQVMRPGDARCPQCDG